MNFDDVEKIIVVDEKETINSGFFSVKRVGSNEVEWTLKSFSYGNEIQKKESLKDAIEYTESLTLENSSTVYIREIKENTVNVPF